GFECHGFFPLGAEALLDGGAFVVDECLKDGEHAAAVGEHLLGEGGEAGIAGGGAFPLQLDGGGDFDVLAQLLVAVAAEEEAEEEGGFVLGGFETGGAGKGGGGDCAGLEVASQGVAGPALQLNTTDSGRATGGGGGGGGGGRSRPLTF